MNKIIIIADSTCDLTPELIKEYDIKIFPLHVAFDGDDHYYLDGVDLNSDQVYKKVNECGNTPKTGAINIAELIGYFKPYIDEGDDIIFTGIGSG